MPRLCILISLLLYFTLSSCRILYVSKGSDEKELESSKSLFIRKSHLVFPFKKIVVHSIHSKVENEIEYITLQNRVSYKFGRRAGTHSGGFGKEKNLTTYDGKLILIKKDKYRHWRSGGKRSRQVTKKFDNNGKLTYKEIEIDNDFFIRAKRHYKIVIDKKLKIRTKTHLHRMVPFEA